MAIPLMGTVEGIRCQTRVMYIREITEIYDICLFKSQIHPRKKKKKKKIHEFAELLPFEIYNRPIIQTN